MKDIDTLVRASDAVDEVGNNKSKYQLLRNLVMQLRKCCLHPFLFAGAEVNIANTTLGELISASGKLAVLDKMLLSMFKNGNRTVIFSQFTSMLDILEDYCAMRGWKYCRFDGSTPRAQRNYIINNFNAPDSDIFIFLMITKSGGLGINLQTADTCILYDSDWNPQPDLQAMARVHRIGQKKVVHIYRLVSAGTVEERVLQRAEKKLYLDQMVNRGITTDMENDDDEAGLTASELLSTLKFGSNAIFRSTNELPSNSEIDSITDRKRTEKTSCGLLKGGASNTAEDFNVDVELTDTQTFGGVNFREIRDLQCKTGGTKNKTINKLKEEWSDLNKLADMNGGRGKRNKKNRIMNIKDDNGTTHQVFSINNYDLTNGEPSVFKGETKKTSGMSNPKREKKGGVTHVNQDICQICGDFGDLILCPRCPISVHPRCCGLNNKTFQNCTHHNCIRCNKSSSEAGGLLFACDTCPSAYCEDCLPSSCVRYLGYTTERLQKLGYEGNSRTVYIHCSKQCENVARKDFNWKQTNEVVQRCPDDINVSYAFGSEALSVQEIAKKHAEINVQAIVPIMQQNHETGTQESSSKSLSREKRVAHKVIEVPRYTPTKIEQRRNKTNSNTLAQRSVVAEVIEID
jgi:SWI/SNF-related matrix-associated actin-dependent regulator of chromatin subfamily A member 5